MTKKRILHIITRLDPGGSAENTVLSAERVAPGEFESYVLTGPGMGVAGVPDEYVKRLGDRLIIESTLVRRISPLDDLLCLYRLRNHIRELKPEIVHLHSAKSGALGRVAAKLSRTSCKVIYTPHGHVFSGYGGAIASFIYTSIEKILAPRTDAIVALTADEIREFQAVKAGKPDQFHIIPSGVDLRAFSFDQSSRTQVREKHGLNESTPVVGFCGRLVEVKGPDRFLDVVSLLNEMIPEMHAMILGEGEMRAEMENAVDHLGLTDKVHWMGWQNPIPYYSAFDLLLMTSRNEGMGRVIVEAAAAACTTVAMNTGGVGEVIVDGETGYTVPNEDIKGVADKAAELLTDQAKRKQFADAARDHMHDTFSVEAMITKLEILYRSLLKA